MNKENLINYIEENGQSMETDQKQSYILSRYFNVDNRVIGLISSQNYIKIIKYDDNGLKIFEEDSDGNWEKRKYLNGFIIQFSTSSGTHWVK